jgi:hypothetical protein
VSESGIVVALIGLVSAVLVALIAVWRFYRKDRADAEAVEEGTISGRFKDADSLMQYIDERVDARTAEMSRSLEGVTGQLKTMKTQFDELTEAVHANVTQQWLWDRRGRRGPLPMLPGPVLSRLRLGHLMDPDFDDTENPTRPPAGGLSS